MKASVRTEEPSGVARSTFLSSTRPIFCVLCGVDDVTVLWVKDGFRYVECARCGLVYVNPQLLPEEIVRLYALGFESKSQSKPTPADFSGYAPLLGVAAEYRQTGRLLDVGCFKGHLLLAARADGWAPFGTEISLEAAAYARREHQIEVFCGELTAAGYPDGFFDVVLLQDVIEHLSDPLAYLREIGRILRPGGAVYLETPNFDGVTRYLLGRDWCVVFPWHQFYFRPATLRRVLEAAHLSVSTIRCISLAPLSRYNPLRSFRDRHEIASPGSSLRSWVRQRARFLRRPYRLARSAGNVPFMVLSAVGLHVGTKMIVWALRPASSDAAA